MPTIDPNNFEQAKRIERERAEMGKLPNQEFLSDGRRNPRYNKPSSGGGGDCFPQGTLIRTANGDRDIESIERNDLVIAFDFKQNRFVTRRVIRKIDAHLSSNLVELELSNGKTIQVTANHTFDSDKVRIKAKNLMGKSITAVSTNSEKNHIKVVSVRKVSKPINVYNLIVEKNFNFIASNTLVYSISYFPKVQKQIYKIYDRLSSKRSIAEEYVKQPKVACI